MMTNVTTKNHLQDQDLWCECHKGGILLNCLLSKETSCQAILSLLSRKFYVQVQYNKTMESL